MKNSADTDPATSLCTSFTPDRALIVCGTGVSTAAFPDDPATSWIKLLEHGKAFLGDRATALERDEAAALDLRPSQDGSRPMRAEDFLAAFSAIRSALDRADTALYAEWLQSAFQGYRRGKMSGAGRDLVDAIGRLRAPIATTNIDSLLSDVFGRRPITWLDDESINFVEYRRDDVRQSRILHLHGIYSRPETVVLGQEEYDAHLKDKRSQNGLHSLGLNIDLIFIGCSAAGVLDPGFKLLLTSLSEHFGARESGIYVLCRDDDAAGLERAFDDAGLSQHQAQAIVYGRGYGDLPRFLRRLAPQSGTAATPARPQHFIERSGILRELKDTIQASEAATVISNPQGAAVAGMGGVGKTVLAAELARDPAFSEKYKTVWIVVGREMSPVRLMEHLMVRLVGRLPMGSLATAQREFRDHIGTRVEEGEPPILLVLDDVWSSAIVDAVADAVRAASDTPEERAIAEGVTILVTARDHTAFGALPSFPVPFLDDADALRLLLLNALESAGDGDVAAYADDPAILHIAKACGGLPLALTSIGKLLRVRSGIVEGRRVLDTDYVERRLQGEGITRQFIDDRLKGDGKRLASADIRAVLATSIDALEDERYEDSPEFSKILTKSYLNLCIFPDDAAIPVEMLEKFVARLFEDRTGQTENGHPPVTLARRCIDIWLERNIAMYSGEGRISIHDLYHEIITERSEGEFSKDAAASYIDFHLSDVSSDYSSVDSFFFEHAAVQFVQAGRVRQFEALQYDLAWIRRRAGLSGASALISDLLTLAAANTHHHARKSLALLYDFVRLCAPAISDSADTRSDRSDALAVQLSSRFDPQELGDKRLRGLIRTAAAETDRQPGHLVPASPTLMSPKGFQKQTVDCGAPVTCLVNATRLFGGAGGTDQRVVLAGTRKGEVVVVDFETGEVVKKLPVATVRRENDTVVPNGVTSIAVSDDGRAVAVATEYGEISVWGLRHFDRMADADRVFPAPQPLYVTWLPGRGCLLAVSPDTPLQAFGRTLDRLDGAASGLPALCGCGLAILPERDGRRAVLAVIAADRTVTIAAGDERGGFTGPQERVAFAPDDGEGVPTALVALHGRTDPLDDGFLVATDSGHIVRLSATGDRIGPPREHFDARAEGAGADRRSHGSVMDLATTDRGDRLVSVGKDHHVRLWFLAGIGGIDIGQHGYFVNAATIIDERRGRQTRHPQHTGQQATDLRRGNNPLRLSSLYAVSGSEDHLLKFWDVSEIDEYTPPPTTSDRHTSWVREIAADAQGRFAVSASKDTTLKIWAPKRGDGAGPVAVTETLRDGSQNHSIEAVAVCPVTSVIASADKGGFVRLWEGSPRTPRLLGQVTTCANSVHVSPDGRWIAAGGEEGHLVIWDARHGRAVFDTKGLMFNGNIRTVRFTPDNKHIVIATETREKNEKDIILPNSDTILMGRKHLFARFIIDSNGMIDPSRPEWPADTDFGHDDFIRSFDFDPSTDRMITASEDGRVGLWRYSTLQKANLGRIHRRRVRGAAFLRNHDNLVASYSSDHYVMISDIGKRLETAKEWEVRARFWGDSPITGLGQLSDGRLIVGEVFGAVHVLQADFCFLAGKRSGDGGEASGRRAP